MFRRTAASIVLISLTAATIFLLPVWAFSAVASIFIAMALHEFFRMNSKEAFPEIFTRAGMFLGVSLPYMAYFCISRGYAWENLFFIFSVFTLVILQFTRRENRDAVVLIAVTLFGIIYVAWFFIFLLKTRFLENGHNLTAYLLLVTKTGDMGAYLIGSRFGRHALFPRISPNKSVEGALGGFLFSMFFALIAKGLLRGMPFGVILCAGILIAVFTQLGDLAESLIKRNFNVKDSSSLIPGLGGMLDVIDSILFTAPVFYVFLCIVMR